MMKTVLSVPVRVRVSNFQEKEKNHKTKKSRINFFKKKIKERKKEASEGYLLRDGSKKMRSVQKSCNN